ncbi:predicted protein [Lichtheimia corymbifera JMRC:FSU:9682]|uniref:Uncharacterized protein n=1 Tax=Lichtheimia corymbifera JMRC:FSU:9682 TaxID=1263082 RepID=A0A068RTT5_9FUNG|nr:predicted protein [Lichtheimia corymbifera JMRC:FSU:9682]
MPVNRLLRERKVYNTTIHANHHVECPNDFVLQRLAGPIVALKRPLIAYTRSALTLSLETPFTRHSSVWRAILLFQPAFYYCCIA